MAGTKRNAYAIGDTNFDAMMTTLDLDRRGKGSVTLTEMATTTVPKIAAGSWIEVGGAVYEFTADESLQGTPSDGTVYIYIVPSATTCTAIMSNSAPVWSDAKQGWYGAGSGYRCVDFYMIKSTAVYKKYLSTRRNKNRFVNFIQATAGGQPNGVQPFTSVRDAYSEVASGGITIKNGGFYNIQVRAEATSGGGSAIGCTALLYINGAQPSNPDAKVFSATSYSPSAVGSPNSMAVYFSGMLYLNTGDVLTIDVSGFDTGGRNAYITIEEQD